MTVVRASPGVLRGHLAAPASKSYTHRALVAAHLTGRRYRIGHPLESDDTRATARAIAALGTPVREAPGDWTVLPSRARTSAPVTIDCGESGTTLRFVLALAARGESPVRLTGRGRLPDRPIEELLQALESLGATCERPPSGRGLPTVVRGPIHGGALRLDASQSSQFVSALLLTLPTLPEDSRLRLEGEIVSEPYIEATLAILRHHGVRWSRRGRTFAIPGRQRYVGDRFDVPGDASSAAYFWAGAAVTGGELRVTGVPARWPQADLAALDLLEDAGARVRRTSRGVTVRGGRLHGFSFDLTRSPDLYPLAGVLAATIPEESHLRGGAQVAWKESDRRAETIRVVRAMGATVVEEPDGLSILGTDSPRGFGLTDLTDHRLVMSAAVAALAGDASSSIGDARAVRKSYPGFWTALRSVREGHGR